MRFDVAGARRAGYSDEEIAQFLARERGFDFDGARKSGYSGSEVLDFLTARAPAAAAASSPDPVDYSDAATAMQGTPMSSPPRQRDSRPAPAPKPAPTPYRNRLEALDDAVNLIEEGVDLKRVASSFNQIGIQEADIVAHGVGRKSPMFADPGLSRRQIDQYVRPTQPASPQITGEVRPVETTLLEDTANLGRRVAARTRQSVANTLFQAGAIDQDGAAQVFAQNQRRIQAAAPPESVQEGLREFGNAETFTDAAIALATNPKATFVALTESLLQTAPALAITALRAPTLLRASSVGASSGALEFGSAMADVLSDRGVDLTNAAAISEALRKPEVVDQIREKGTTRGLTIGAIDALTAGFAGKFLRPVQDAIYAGRMGEQAARRATLGAWGKELGMQVAGGAGGEALAQNLTGEFKPTDILLEGLAEGISSPIEARSNLQQARALSPDSQIASAIQSGVDGAQFVGTDAAARAALSPYSNAQTNLRTRFAPEAPSADEAMASLRAATTVDDATSAAERLAGSLDDMAPDLTAPLVPRVTLPAVADLPPFDPSLPLMEQPGAGGLISGEIESQFGLDRLRALNPLAESPPIASTQPPAPAPTSTQTAALLTPPRPSTIRGVPTTQLSDEALQQIVGDQTAPPISRRSASIELTARQAQTPALLSPPRTPQESSNGTPLDLGLEAARRDAGSPVVDLAELGRAGMPDAPDGLLGGDTAGAQARARAQQSLDRWAEQNGVETPVKLGTAAPREEAAVNEIATALGSQFGGRVYAFSDPSNKVEGVAIDGAAFVNTAAPTISTAKTSLHEFKHTVEQLAKAETEAGLSNTAAQQFTTQIESIFDDIAEPGRRAYVERYLHKDELDDLFNPQTGKGSGTLEQREARLAELMSAPTTRSEMTADFLGNRATDKDFWNDIAQQDPQGFKGFVQKWIGIVDGLLGKLRGARGQSRGEAARVDYYVRDLQKAKMVAREALIAYSKSTRAPDSTAIAAPQGQTQAAPQFSRSAPSDVNAMGFYSALGRNVAAIKTNAAPAAGWKDAIKGLVNKGQAKAEEVEWSGVNDWLDMQQGKVTRDQVAEYLRQGGVQVEETVLGGAGSGFKNLSRAEMIAAHERIVGYDPTEDEPDITDADLRERLEGFAREAGEADGITEDGRPMPKYGQYTLPGGENYREVLLTLPERATPKMDGGQISFNPDENAARNYRSAHWDQPNVLAHIRVNDRTDADGKRVLFVEEIQSDWGQEGKKKGFKGKTQEDAKRFFGITDEDWSKTSEMDREAYRNEMIDYKGRDIVPAAPFVTKTEGWLNLALKRVITMAAEGGYDRVAFVTGEQSADRFDLSKQVDHVLYRDNGDGTLDVFVNPKQGEQLAFQDQPPAEVERHLGKELTQRLLNGEGAQDRDGLRRLSGLDLKVGGEGMKAFYDTIVPTALKKLLPKVGGGQIGPVEIGDGANGNFWTDGPDDDGSWSLLEGEDGEVVESGLPQSAAKDAANQRNGVGFRQPGFDITPAMREKVATTGVPLFSKTQQLPDEGPMGDAQAQPPRAARGATKASPVQRGGTVEQAGEFTIRTQKDGTLGVAGDAAAIRAMLPEDVRGRVVPGGMVFTTSDAPRVRAALEGRQVAYSRAGQVLDKLPMKNGKYLGAPEKYNTPAKISTLRKNLRQLALEGEPGRYWYENSSREVLAMVGGNVQEARKFVALLAIYSPQAKVDANSTFALRAWAQYKAGQTINVKTAVMDRKAQAALDDVDAFWSGQKTGNFFFNLLREIDPTTAGKQGATIDMWMMRAGEYASDAPTATQYAFMENEVNRLAQELGWEPQQVQAAIWVAMKARMENPGVKKRTEASSEKKGWIRFDYPLKKGKPKKTRVIQNARAHRDNWLKHAFDHDPTKSDTAGAKFDFSDGLRRHVGQLSWEARPGRSTNVLPGVNDAPYDQQVEFQQAVQRALLDDDGIDLLAWKLGLLIDGPDILAPGVWQGEIAAGMQKQIGMAPAKGAAGKTSVDPAQKKAVETYAAMLGLLLRQEGVGYHRPFYKGKKSDENGVDLILDRTFTPAEAQALWGAIDERMKAAGVQDWENGAGLISSPTGMRVVNFGAIADNRSFRDLVRDAAETLAVESVELESFSTDGDLVFNDWRANPNGEGYRSRISEAYGPDLLDWARDVLAPRVQSVFDEFSARYGWGDPGQVDALFGERPQAGAERAAEEVGPAAGAAADGAAPDIRFSRAQGQQPSAGNMISGRDELGYRTFGIGEAAYAKAAQIAENVLTRLSNATGGLVAFKPIDPKLNRAIRKMRTELEKAQNVTAGVASQLKDIPEDERQMISDVIEGELRAGVTPPPRVLQLAASISQIMSQQSAELVRLGMLTQDAAARWDGKYLPRFYEQKLGDEVKAWAKAARSLFGRTRAMAGIKGDSLKARGKFETVEVDALPEWQAQGWEVRDPDYDPASSTEVRIWRDFTKDERERMGEIRDAMFRFTMGYMKSQRDVALGRLYERLNADVASRTEKPGYVRVPQSRVEDTNARRYGKLAGRWVPREVMDHLSALDASTDNQVFALYKKGLAKWKEGKTVLNPVAHANNIVSNLTMAHFAGVSYWDVQKYAGAVRDLMRNNATVDEAKEAGLFGGTFNRAELIDDLPPQLKMLAGMTESKLGKGAETVWNAMSFFLNKPMGKAYDAEDKFFRFLIYREARARGLGVDDAVDYAQRFIFTYDNLPKGARAVRDFGLPFFGYTYKVLPVLLQTAMEHPLRMAAPAAILYATNAAMYALASAADGEDDWAELLKRYVTDAEFRANAMAMQAEERKNLPEWMKGNTALGTPKAVRLWTDAVTGLPMFLDVSRMVPSGDLFDVVNQAGGVPLPAPITPTNPVLTTAYAMFANKDTFKGKDVIDANDTSSEAAEKRSAWLWRQFTPALAVGNYHFNRTVDAIANATGKPIDLGLGEFTGIGRDGLPVQPGLAALQTVGIKARPVDLEMSERITSAQRERTIRELQAEIRQLNRLEGLGAVSPEAADRNREKQREKIQRLRDGLTVDAETVE